MSGAKQVNVQVNEVGMQVYAQMWGKAKCVGVGGAAKVYRTSEHTQNPTQTQSNTYY